MDEKLFQTRPISPLHKGGIIRHRLCPHVCDNLRQICGKRALWHLQFKKLLVRRSDAMCFIREANDFIDGIGNCDFGGRLDLGKCKAPEGESGVVDGDETVRRGDAPDERGGDVVSAGEVEGI